MERTKPSPTPSAPAQTAPATTLRIRPKSRRGGNLLLDLPIGGRLTLGFLTAAMVAALITGVIGVQRSQSLSRQSDFYQNLLQINTSLTTGADFLQLMNTELQQITAVANGPNPSKETIAAGQNATNGLANRYNTIINEYTRNSLLDQHPEQVNLLIEGNHVIQITQQQTLAGSALRAWRVYQTAQTQILQNIQSGNAIGAQTLLRVQGEPTNADAQSALRALIRFDQRLAASVRDAASIEEQNQLISTVIGAVIAFILIATVGWFISNTLVRRLKHLRQITQSVEQGQLNARVTVIGRDEIADVSASFNAMLEAIVGLVEETRQQRDALTNAAEHLFSDMRVVSAGDLRVNAPVSNDPIGMLANAFNFTVGRFRRFILRTQGVVEQLDVISRQELERTENFIQNLNMQIPTGSGATPASNLSRPLSLHNEAASDAGNVMSNDNAELIAQIQHIRGRMQQLSNDGISRHTRSVLSLAEQSAQTLQRINRMRITTSDTLLPESLSTATTSLEELHALERSIQRMTTELQNVQKNITRGFLEVDTDLTRLSANTRALKNQAQPKSQVAISGVKDNSTELMRQSVGFAKEVTTMARQLATLAQEMRVVVVSFQLDAANAGVPLSIKEESASPYKRGTTYELSEEKNAPDQLWNSQQLPGRNPRGMKLLSNG